MSREPPPPPTLALLESILPEHGKFPFDRTLEAARNDIGSQPDLANPEHAKRLRIWLNQWLCRIGYPGMGDDLFADSLASWWRGFKDTLPPHSVGLAQLTDVQLRAVSDAYGDLYVRRAAVSRTGRTRRVAAAAAKLLYFVRPPLSQPGTTRFLCALAEAVMKRLSSNISRRAALGLPALKLKDGSLDCSRARSGRTSIGRPRRWPS